MTILCNPEYLTEIDISKVEKRYNAKYVFESPLQTSGGWRDEPSLIFYCEKPHPEGSNYFAISRSGSEFVISDGISAVETPITGIRDSDGTILYSRCRHDFRTAPLSSVSIDGGRDYLRVVGDHSQLVQLQVVNGDLVEVKENLIQ